MIESVIIRDHGQSLTLHLARPEESGLTVTNIDGLGPVKEEISMSDRGFSDGAYYNGSRKSYRNIVITLRYTPNVTSESVSDFVSDYATEIEKIRHKTFLYFPTKRKLVLLFETETGLYRCEGYVESNESSVFSNACESVISIVCPDPYFAKCKDKMGSLAFTNSIKTTSPVFSLKYEGETATDCFVQLTKKNTKIFQKIIIQNGSNDTGVTLNAAQMVKAGDLVRITHTRHGHRTIDSNVSGRITSAIDMVENISKDWMQVYPGENYISIRTVPPCVDSDFDISVSAEIRTVGI